MTVEELKKIGKDKVRNDAGLLSEYKRLFAEKFGREPVCAGCTFNNDWVKLTGSYSGINIQNTNTMSDTTFKLRDPHAIYTYRKTDDKTGASRAVRSFGNKMSEEFANNYLTIGTEDELKRRRSEFAVLPTEFFEAKETETENQGSEEVSELSKLTVPKLQELATEKEYPADEWKNLKKDELVVYLEAKETETEN